MNKILIVLLIFLLSLTGCTTETTNIEDNENVEEVQMKDNENKVDTKENKEDNEEVKEDNAKPVEDNKNEEKVTDLGEETTENINDLENIEPETEDVTNDNVQKENQPQEVNIPEPVEENSTEEDEVVLKIEGLVGNELSLSLNELKEMNDLIFEADFYSLNSFGTTGYTHFKGINLWNLLELNALVSDDASIVTVVAQDGYKMEFTIDQVKKQDYIDETNPDNKYPMIIAWEEDQEEYDVEGGAPFKLVVGQKEAGDVNKPQWVSNIDKILVE